MELGSNPLFLTLLLARYIRREISPSYVTESISGFMDAVIDDWDSTRGIMRTADKPLSPTTKFLALKLVSNYLFTRKIDVFSTSEISDVLGLLSTETAPGRVMQILVEHTSLVREVKKNCWKFRSQYVKEYMLASQRNNDLLNIMVERLIGEEDAPKDQNLVRVLRFLAVSAGNASDAVRKILGSAPPYRADIAIAMSEIMTQRLAVEPSVVGGYAAYVRVVLEQLLAYASRCEFQFGTASADGTVWLAKIWANTFCAEGRWLEVIGELLRVLHKTRDGSACHAVVEEFENRASREFTGFSKLLKAEGRWESIIEKEDRDSQALVMRVVQGEAV